MDYNPDSVLDVEKKWYAVTLPTKSCSLKDIANATLDQESIEKLYEEARQALEEEKKLASQVRGHWYTSQFLTRGTQADKIASAAVKLADTDFMFFLDGFNLLFDTARSDSHHYEAALKALTAVWEKLLPPRPLKRFAAQYFATLPSGEETAIEEEAVKDKKQKMRDTPMGQRKKVLVYWYVEDYLKKVYAQFLALCESMLKDRVQQRREAWLEVVGKLVSGVAEGRTISMGILITKLGDPSSQVGHKAYHYILQLLSESSMHQGPLFTELEKIIFTKNCPVRTMRYAVNILNQLVFSKDERKLALRSVQTYFSLFRQLAKTEKLDSSVATAIMIGLRRAYPYAGADHTSLDSHMDALFILSHNGNFQQRVSTLSLLQLVASHKNCTPAFQTRWYRALYDLLLISPQKLPHATQLTNFFTLLHKAVRSDTNPERVAAFAHRLLQRSLFFHDAMTCAVLLLVGEMVQAHPIVRSLLSPSATDRAEQKASGDNSYNPKHRDPQFAKASRECLWTLNLLARHSHPNVVKLAVLLLFQEELVFDVHPLDDMTLLNFLEMLVDSSGGGASTAEKSSVGTEKVAATGISVFRRAGHKSTLPSVSDPYFVKAKPTEVDVSALFLHRYAVQRQRFLDGLNQTQSTWGDASGEADVALRVATLDTSLFGPAGALRGDGDTEVSPGSESEVEADPLTEDAFIPSEEDASEEGDLDWGDEDAMDSDGLDEDAMDSEEDEGETLSKPKRRGVDAEGDDFGELIEQHKVEKSKKRKREDAWMEERSRPAPRTDSRSSFRGRGGGRGASSRGRFRR